jgi:hypothetical protein
MAPSKSHGAKGPSRRIAECDARLKSRLKVTV